MKTSPKHKSPSHSTALFFTDCFINFGSLGAPFWLPLGSILAPFWSSLASIWPPWRRLGRITRNVYEFPRFLSPFWLHFDTILAQKSKNVRVKNCIDFLIDFLSHFSFILEAFFHTFSFQNRARIGKGDFVKMSFSPARGAHFQRS